MASPGEERRVLITTQQGQKSPLELLWHSQAKITLYPHHSLAKTGVYVHNLVFAA